MLLGGVLGSHAMDSGTKMTVTAYKYKCLIRRYSHSCSQSMGQSILVLKTVICKIHKEREITVKDFTDNRL